MEKVISDEESKGKRVRAFVLNNPQNPLGKVFNAEMVQEIMKLCQRFISMFFGDYAKIPD